MEILLKQHELLDLGKQRPGYGVICLSGACWLTQAGDNRDHILRTGDSFNSSMRGQLVVTATEDCRLMLVTKSRVVKSSSPWQPLTCNTAG